MPRSITRVAPLRRILTAAEPEVMVQLVRLIVLFEDLKLEGMSLNTQPNQKFDASEHYRGMYFVRKAFGTIWEMDSAFHKLNMLHEFKEKKQLFPKERLKQWTNAVRFFSKHKHFIDHQRNTYGGHVTDEVARFILSKVQATDDTHGSITVKLNDDHTHRLAFEFAEPIVDHAFFIDRGARDHREFLNESFEILMQAVRHASVASQILADVYIMPVFGW